MWKLSSVFGICGNDFIFVVIRWCILQQRETKARFVVIILAVLLRETVSDNFYYFVEISQIWLLRNYNIFIMKIAVIY